jgi:hypothetical protein
LLKSAASFSKLKFEGGLSGGAWNILMTGLRSFAMTFPTDPFRFGGTMEGTGLKGKRASVQGQDACGRLFPGENRNKSVA